MTDEMWVQALLAPQPDPVGDGPSVTDAALATTSDHRIAALLVTRRAQGVARYGTELRAHNGRDVRADLVQEFVDAILYARQYGLERCDGGETAAVLQSHLSLYLTRIGWTP